MLALLIYCYVTGRFRSREIEEATHADVVVRYICGGDKHPDHDTIAEFRKRHLKALSGLFVEALQLCQKVGLVKLGHVSLDGTKVRANASKHKAMSYGRMEKKSQELEAEVEALLAEAQAVDDAEDAKSGKDKRGHELPEELRFKQDRLKKIKEVCGFRRFLLRGLQNVSGEWDLICLTHDLLKLFRSGLMPKAA